MKPGDRVRTKSRVYDRHMPETYSVERGDVGEVHDVVERADGVTVATISFGACVAVVNVLALDPVS